MFKLQINELNVNAPVFVPEHICENEVKSVDLKNADIDTLVSNVNKLISEITQLYLEKKHFDKLEIEFVQKNPWFFE